MDKVALYGSTTVSETLGDGITEKVPGMVFRRRRGVEGRERER